MAGAEGRLIVEVQGLDKLMAKLEPKDLYWAPLKGALDKLGREGAAAATSSAGSFRRTGLLASSMSYKVNSVPVPLWVAVINSATSKTGRRYPWILEFDGRFGHRNWLLNSIKRVQAGAEAAVSAAVSAIEARWGG